MKRKHIFIISAVLFLILLTVCILLSVDKAPVKDAAGLTDLYNREIPSLTQQETVSYRVNYIKRVQYDGYYTLESSCQQILLQDETHARIEQQILGPGSEVTFTATYADETAYLLMENGNFSSPMSFEDFSVQFPPAKLLETDIYTGIEAKQIHGCSALLFTEPAHVEKWADTESKQMISSNGFAVFTKQNQLRMVRYNLQYQQNGKTITECFFVWPDYNPDSVKITVPDTGEYTQINNIMAPILLEKACVALEKAHFVDSVITDIIDSQLSTVNRQEVTHLQIDNRTDFAAVIDTQLVVTDYSRSSVITDRRQEESYQQGAYSLIVDGAQQTPEDEVTLQKMQTYCRDKLLGNIITPQYITDVKVDQSQEQLTLHFTASQELSELLCSNISQILYQDSALMHTLATAYETEELTCSITIEKDSCLPVDYAVLYRSKHSVEGATYAVTAHTEQTFQYKK